MKVNEVLKAVKNNEPVPIKVTVNYDFFRSRFKERGLLSKEVEMLFRDLERIEEEKI